LQSSTLGKNFKGNVVEMGGELGKGKLVAFLDIIFIASIGIIYKRKVGPCVNPLMPSSIDDSHIVKIPH